MGELLALPRFFAVKLINMAADLMPLSQQERYREEWLAELDNLHNFGFSIPQLIYALRIYFGAPNLRMSLLDIEEAPEKISFIGYLFVIQFHRFLVWAEPKAFRQFFKKAQVYKPLGKARVEEYINDEGKTYMTILYYKHVLGAWFRPKWYQQYCKEIEDLEEESKPDRRQSPENNL